VSPRRQVLHRLHPHVSSPSSAPVRPRLCPSCVAMPRTSQRSLLVPDLASVFPVSFAAFWASLPLSFPFGYPTGVDYRTPSQVLVARCAFRTSSRPRAPSRHHQLLEAHAASSPHFPYYSASYLCLLRVCLPMSVKPSVLLICFKADFSLTSTISASWLNWSVPLESSTHHQFEFHQIQSITFLLCFVQISRPDLLQLDSKSSSNKM
jgi:hypothetical protein